MQGSRAIYKLAHAIMMDDIIDYKRERLVDVSAGEIVLNKIWDAGVSELVGTARECGLISVKRSYNKFWIPKF